MLILTLLCGAMVGFSLGLTGGGGAIFAVPLLVYVLGVAPRDAVEMSLLSVACTSLVGFAQRARRTEVEFSTGLIFALAGMLGAPAGIWLAQRIAEPLLLTLFALLMLVIAARMWTKSSDANAHLPILDHDTSPTCHRDPAGKLRLTSRCTLLLIATGLGVGVLTGLFGVGGGFIIVPALGLFTGITMPRAIGTSLFVMFMVSASSVANHWLAGRIFDTNIALLFTAGSIAGLFAGTALGQRFAAQTLQRIFAVVIVCVAIFVIARNVF